MGWTDVIEMVVGAITALVVIYALWEVVKMLKGGWADLQPSLKPLKPSPPSDPYEMLHQSSENSFEAIKNTAELYETAKVSGWTFEEFQAGAQEMWDKVFKKHYGESLSEMLNREVHKPSPAELAKTEALAKNLQAQIDDMKRTGAWERWQEKYWGIHHNDPARILDEAKKHHVEAMKKAEEALKRHKPVPAPHLPTVVEVTKRLIRHTEPTPPAPLPGPVPLPIKKRFWIK